MEAYKELSKLLDKLMTDAIIRYTIQSISYTRAMAVLDSPDSTKEERQAANGILGRLTWGIER